MKKFSPFAKAIYGALVSALVAFGGALSTALADSGASFASLSDGQWVTAIVAGLGALPIVGATVYAVSNKPRETTEPEDTFTETEL